MTEPRRRGLLRGAATVVATAVLAGAFALCVSRPAQAHCVGPDVVRPMLRSTTPTDIQLYMNFGSALSIDDGATWKLQCEEVFQPLTEMIPPQNELMTPSGALVLAHFRGLFVSHDRGCNYVSAAGAPVEDNGDGTTSPIPVLDAALDSGDPENGVWALVGDTLFRSTDAGACVKPVKRFCDHTLLRITTSPADAKVVYIVSYLPRGVGSLRWILSTLDGGTTWELHETTYDNLEVAAVSPTDGHEIYAVAGNTDQTVVVSKDRGATFTEVFAATRDGISGFDAKVHVTLGAGAGELFAGIRGDDGVAGNAELHHSIDDGATWAQVAGAQPHFRCLTFLGGKLWGCGNNRDAMGDAFALGVSTDGGMTWTPKFSFGTLCQTISASACSGVTTSACVPGLCDAMPPYPSAMGPTCATTGLTASPAACTYPAPEVCASDFPESDVEPVVEPSTPEPRDAGGDRPVDAPSDGKGGGGGGGCCRTAGAGTPQPGGAALALALVVGIAVSAASGRRRRRRR